jgi:hypothetical protein
MPEPIPTITAEPSKADAGGCWHFMTPQVAKRLAAIRKDPTKLKDHVEASIRATDFLRHLKTAGDDAFGDAHDAAGNPMKLAKWEDPKSIQHTIEVKAAMQEKGLADADEGPNAPVSYSGAAVMLIRDSQGNVSFVTHTIRDVSFWTGTAAGIAGLIAWIIQRILTARLNYVQSAVNSAIQLGWIAGEHQVPQAAQQIARLSSAAKFFRIAGDVFMFIGIVAMLTDFFVQLFHKTTMCLSVWNDTDVDLEYSVSYIDSRCVWINPDPGVNVGAWLPLPKRNAASGDLANLGVGSQPHVASGDIMLASGAKEAVITAVGVHACVSIRQKGTGTPACVILIEAPLVGKNSMSLGAGAGDGTYFNTKVNSAQQTFRTTFDFSLGGRALTGTLCTDQIEGETSYIGVEGYNYTMMMQINQA